MHAGFIGKLTTVFGQNRTTRIFELARYFIVGASNILIDFVIYVAFTRGWDFWREHYLWANCISFLAVVTWSFFWNKFWTFKERSDTYHMQYVKFILVTVVGLAIYQSTLAIGVEYFRQLDLIAKLIATPAMALWNYCMHKFWTFRVAQS